MKKTIATIAFGLLGLSLSAQVPSYVPINGLVGWWPFNGSTNDESANGNNGTNNGATLSNDRFGNTNSAYSFNGTSSYINIPNSASLQFNGGLTISAWINAASLPSPVSYWFSKGADGGTPYSWVSSVPNAPINQAAVNVFNNASIPAGGNSNSYVALNQLVNVVATFDGSFSKMYFNGLLENSTATTYTTFANTYDLKFGRRHTSGSPYFWNGKLDDFGVWNRALTQQEISNLYNGNICYQNITVTDTLLINTGITGFNPITYKNTIKVWPNPTNDHITIDNGNIANLTGYQIKITNSLSQQVFQSAITQQQFYVDLSTWTGNGIYFVHIIDGQGNTIEIKKIVLQ